MMNTNKKTKMAPPSGPDAPPRFPVGSGRHDGEVAGIEATREIVIRGEDEEGGVGEREREAHLGDPIAVVASDATTTMDPRFDQISHGPLQLAPCADVASHTVTPHYHA
jgi:hypothetical protein